MLTQVTLTKDYIIEGTLIKQGSSIFINELDIDDLILMEMSKPFEDIASYMAHSNNTRMEHLIKLYYLRNQPMYSNNFVGWIVSARKGFEKQIFMSKGRGKDTFPPSDRLYKAVWIPYVEKQAQKDHDKLITKVNRNLIDFLPITNTDYENFIKFATEYHRWAFDIIEEYGKVEAFEAEDKIKELLKIV